MKKIKPIPQAQEAEEQRELPEGLNEQYGSCRYCGQMKMFHTAEPWSEDALDEAATEACSCEEARAETRRNIARKNAEGKLQLLFGEKADLDGVMIDDRVIGFMHQAIVLLALGLLDKASMNLGDGITAGFTINGEGVIRIRRTIKRENTEECV